MPSVRASHATKTPASNLKVARNLVNKIVTGYLYRNPTAARVVRLFEKEAKCSTTSTNTGEDFSLPWDHFAFRTFGVEGLGVEAFASGWQKLGWEKKGELDFRVKKLRATWFGPAGKELGGEEEGYEFLPRIFISEIKVEELSEEAQTCIRKYTSTQKTRENLRHLMAEGGGLATLSRSGGLPWETPTRADYELLAAESEYAAWTLIHGYCLNHTTISVHRLPRHLNTLSKTVDLLSTNGFKLNDSGGVEKISEDGGLRQASTIAESIKYSFRDEGGERNDNNSGPLVPGCYIEFAERLVAPEFVNGISESSHVREIHRRDGFETASADKIFESTALAREEDGQQGRQG